MPDATTIGVPSPDRLSQGIFDGGGQITLDVDGQPVGYFPSDSAPLVIALIDAYRSGASSQATDMMRGQCQAYSKVIRELIGALR